MTKSATCNYWVASKNRYCKFAVVSGSDGKFCAVHNVGSGVSERIPCPVDPRHMIYKRDTEKHVKKCSKVVQVYFEQNQPLRNVGCNLLPTLGIPSANSTDDKNVSESRMVELIPLLESVETGLLERIRVLVPDFKHAEDPATPSDHPDVLLDAEDEELTKHEHQNAALLQVLQSVNLAPKHDYPRIYAELGCGKAGLSRWLIDCLPERGSPESVFLLVDCEARRHKKENRKDLIEKVSPSSVVRLRLNLADVDLSELCRPTHTPTPTPVAPLKQGSVQERIHNLKLKIEAIQSRPDWPLPTIVGTAKHLCGAATDLGIRCLDKIRETCRVSMVLATCCHHRCDWTQLAGRSYLEHFGITENMFREIISVTGWATTTSLPDWKRRIGRLVKRTIDFSRILSIVENFPFIQSVQYRAYISSNVTPENFVIIVRASDP